MSAFLKFDTRRPVYAAGVEGFPRGCSRSAAFRRRRARAAQAPCRPPLDKLVERRGPPGPAFGDAPGGEHQTRLLQLAPAVRGFVGDTADRLDPPPRLGHGESLGQETDGDVGPPELAAQPLDSVADDRRAVEPDLGQLVDGKP